MIVPIDIVGGGWDAVENIIGGIGGGASTFTSDFFPAQQREKVEHLPLMPAGGEGLTYRPTSPDAPSFIETSMWAADQWLGSPYEQQFAIPTKIEESKQLAKTVSLPADENWIGQGLDWALDQTKKVTTLVDELGGVFSKRESIQGEPFEGPKAGTTTHLNQVTNKGAEIYNTGKAFVGGIVDQVKGLFNLGYDPTGKQPTFAIQHELKPGPQITIGAIVIISIIIFALLRSKK